MLSRGRERLGGGGWRLVEIHINFQDSRTGICKQIHFSHTKYGWYMRVDY